MKLVKKTITALMLLLFFSCAQKRVDYHQVNQPQYSTDNFLWDASRPLGNIYGSIKFYKNKRQLYTDLSFFEQLLRSLKGNIKKITIKEINSDNILWNTNVFEFDKKGKISKTFQAFQDEKLSETTYRDTLFANINASAKDSVFIQTNLVRYSVFKGKLYFETSNLYDDFPHMKYWYHANGNKAKSMSLTSWKTTFYNSDGLLDSIADQNKETDPTENQVDRYVYTHNLLTTYVQEQNELFPAKKTKYARVVNATYHAHTDLPALVAELSISNNYRDTLAREKHTYSYDTSNQLISMLHSFDGENPKHMQFQTDYTYQYDAQGNWEKVCKTSFHLDKPAEKFTTTYLISYEYY